MASQCAHVFFTVIAGIYRLHHFHDDMAVVPAIELHFIMSVGHADRHNRHTGCDSGVKRTGFEWHQATPPAAGAFREHPD
ncbi:hypothetical protein D3C84_1114440 [compost metagenome]